MNPLEFINQIKDMYNDQDPRPMAQGSRNMYAGGQLVKPSVDGSRPGYAGRPRGFDIEAVETAINNANKNLKYMSLDDVAKQIDGVKTGSQLQGITKRHNLPKLDSFGTKVEKAWIDLFQDSSRNADEVLKPLYKIAEMVGSKSSKTPGRLRVENISLALKNSKNLDYVNDVKPLINKLSSANFIKKIEGKEWRIFDVESSVYTKSMLRAPKTDAEHLMNYVVRHQDQAGGDAVFNIFDEKSGKRITNMKDVDSYHDIIFKDSKGKTYDMDYLLRNSKTDPMFKEYYDLQNQLKVMRDKQYWPDGSKIIDPKTGRHVTFGNYSGSMHQHGYGYTKAYERFPYETDHLDLKKHPFKNLTILPQRINVALGAADRLKRPDVKYKLGGEHFRNLNVDDLMMQEKDLGKKILLFDKQGNHIGKKLKTPYTAAKIKVVKPVILGSNLANEALKINLKALCPNKKASGGRIGYQDAGAVTKTLECGSKRLEQIILRGGANTKEQELAEKILKAGRGLRGMFSLSGMFGPAATAFLVGTEAGLVGYDMISQGKTFREAVGDSVFNYALGDRTKIDPKEERYKGYAAAGVDKDTIGKISAFENAMDEVKNMQQEFEKEDVAYRDAVISGPRMSGAIKQKQIKNYYDQVKKNQELIKYLEQPQTQEKLKIVDDDLFPAMLTDADAKRKAMQMTKPLTVGFGNTMDFLFPKATYREDRERAINYMPAVQEYYRGGQFAGGRAGYMGGGIAAIRKPHAIPPERQGLRSIMINVNDD